MIIRRVVTGLSEDGDSIVSSDSMLEATTADLFPGFEFHQIWASESANGGSSSSRQRWFPAGGEYRLIHVVIPPDSEESSADPSDAEALQHEVETKLPGLVSVMEPDEPGMHTSQTVDLLFVVSGSIILELDNGAETELGPGDTLVQRGTRHRWHNRGAVPCHLLGTLVGTYASQ